MLKKLINRSKGTRGITLVALIITVIVMLILAGVAISVIVDGEGLFSRTRQAAEEYEQAAKAENTQLQSLMDEIDRYLEGTPINPDGDDEVGDTTAPESATIAVSDITKTTFTLTATGSDKESGITKYEFYINDVLEETVNSAEEMVTYNVTGKAANNIYNCKVLAYNAAGKSTESTSLSVTTPEVIVTVAEQGMVPIVYNVTESSWYIATAEQIDNNIWYDYVDTSEAGKASTSKWANVMLMDNLKVDNNGITTTVTNENLSQLYGKKVTSEGSMYVWIPRYAYQITSNLHNGGEGIVGDIDVVFIDTNNKNGNKTYSTTYPTTTDIGTATGRMNDYVVHPAFSWAKEDGTPVELEGLWIGKFEASATDGTFATAKNGQLATTVNTTTPADSVVLRSIGNVSSWRSINRNQIYLNCYNMNNETNASIYGISTDKDKIDPHLIKNTEWGAAAYLAHSKYGRNKITDETMSNLTGYDTGNGNYKANVVLSTTNNVYGIYDMAGGAWEHTAAYVDSTKGGTLENTYLTSEEYGKALYEEEKDKYKDVYVAAETDDRVNNYNANAHMYGDGIYETSYASYDGTNYVGAGWNGDRTVFPAISIPFVYRGGGHDTGATAGVFTFGHTTGAAHENHGFRSALATL